MDKTSKDLILAELLARKGAGLDLAKLCFPQQLAFVQDPAQFKTLVTPRRAGKSMGDSFALLSCAMENPGSIGLYLTLSRTDAKRIIWPTITELNSTLGLGAKPNESDLSLTFPNKSIVYLSGAKDRKEMNKRRGLPLRKVIVDEAQNFSEMLKELVDEVLVPSTFDTGGDISLTGTPSPVPVGYFYDASSSSAWSHHSWQMEDNPWIKIKTGKTAAQVIAAECKRRGVAVDDPTIQRECFGRWVLDRDSLVFRYDPGLNNYETLSAGGKWEYVLGVDIGFHDADAIAVLGWHSSSPALFLVEEVIATKQGITELASSIEKLIKTYDPMRIVMDTGGLGKKIAEELRKRYSIPIIAAEKTRKFEFIELLNDALRTSKFKAKTSSRFANDCMLVEWDRKGDKPKIKDLFHSDICDAVLYAFREALHWLHVPEVTTPKVGSPQWLKEQEEELERQLEERLQAEKAANAGLDWSFLDE